MYVVYEYRVRKDRDARWVSRGLTSHSTLYKSFRERDRDEESAKVAQSTFSSRLLVQIFVGFYVTPRHNLPKRRTNSRSRRRGNTVEAKILKKLQEKQ